jgi:hypothetical protein
MAIIQVAEAAVQVVLARIILAPPIVQMQVQAALAKTTVVILEHL